MLTSACTVAGPSHSPVIPRENITKAAMAPPAQAQNEACGAEPPTQSCEHDNNTYHLYSTQLGAACQAALVWHSLTNTDREV